MIQRIRTIKPEAFRHYLLWKLEKDLRVPVRVAWFGLFTVCDREGRFKWRPHELKTMILPHDAVDFARLLNALAEHGFVVHYSEGGEEFGCIPSWHDHQVINNRESASLLPAPPETTPTQQLDACPTRAPRDTDSHEHALVEGKGMEGNGREGVCAAASATPPSLGIAFLQLNDSTKYEITKAMVDEWVALYPAIDVLQQLRNMYGWLEGNPQNRKTRTGVMRFIHRWLGKEQNSARAHSSTKASSRQRAISAAAESVD